MVRSVEELLVELEAKEKGPTEPYMSWAGKLQEDEKEHPQLIRPERKGRIKLLTKFSTMRPNYSAKIPEAKEHFGKLPFGPKTKASYNAGLDAGADKNYNAKTTVSLEKKWGSKWIEGVSE